MAPWTHPPGIPALTHPSPSPRPPCRALYQQASGERCRGRGASCPGRLSLLPRTASMAGRDQGGQGTHEASLFVCPQSKAGTRTRTAMCFPNELERGYFSAV